MNNAEAKKIIVNELGAEEFSEKAIGSGDRFRFVAPHLHEKYFWAAACENVWLPHHLEAIAQWMRDPKGVTEA